VTGGWAGGASTIVGPEGQVLTSIGGRAEGSASATIDLNAIVAAKRKNAAKTAPAWGLYRKLYGEAGRP